MSEAVDKEIEAIKVVLSTLESLDDIVRKNVLEYVLKRINFDMSVFGIGPVNPNITQPPITDIPNNTSNDTGGEIHLKAFKESKGPKSAIEMAVVIGYYLQNLAAKEHRKETISVADLTTWFKIADYPLPSGDMRFVLVNAKNSGYLDSVGNGDYKINAVGYNLVKHSLPRKEGLGSVKQPKKKSKGSGKKPTKKK
jgi:hypothetical protein